MSDNKYNLKIKLDDNFKFIDLNLPYIYSLTHNNTWIQSDLKVSSSENLHIPYFIPSIYISAYPNVLNVHVMKNFTCFMTYDQIEPPCDELLQAYEIIMNYLIYYGSKEFKDIEPQILKKITKDNIHYINNCKNITEVKKLLKTLINQLTKGEIDVIELTPNGKITIQKTNVSLKQYEDAENLIYERSKMPPANKTPILKLTSPTSSIIDDPSEFE